MDTVRWIGVSPVILLTLFGECYFCVANLLPLRVLFATLHHLVSTQTSNASCNQHYQILWKQWKWKLVGNKINTYGNEERFTSEIHVHHIDFFVFYSFHMVQGVSTETQNEWAPAGYVATTLLNGALFFRQVLAFIKHPFCSWMQIHSNEEEKKNNLHFLSKSFDIGNGGSDPSPIHNLRLCYKIAICCNVCTVYVTTLTIIAKQSNVGNYFPLSQALLFLYCNVLRRKHVKCIGIFSGQHIKPRINNVPEVQFKIRLKYQPHRTNKIQGVDVKRGSACIRCEFSHWNTPEGIHYKAFSYHISNVSASFNRTEIYFRFRFRLRLHINLLCTFNNFPFVR